MIVATNGIDNARRCCRSVVVACCAIAKGLLQLMEAARNFADIVAARTAQARLLPTRHQGFKGKEAIVIPFVQTRVALRPLQLEGQLMCEPMIHEGCKILSGVVVVIVIK